MGGGEYMRLFRSVWNGNFDLYLTRMAIEPLVFLMCYTYCYMGPNPPRGAVTITPIVKRLAVEYYLL